LKCFRAFSGDRKEWDLNTGLPVCPAGTISLEPHYHLLNNQRKLGKELEHVGIGNYFLNKHAIPHTI
jgi:hypothetical protein